MSFATNNFQINRMLHGLKVFFLFTVSFCFVLNLSATLRHPSNDIVAGNADNYGFARITRDLNDIFGIPSIVKTQMIFSSSPQKEPKYFGLFWSLSIFDTSLKELNQEVLEWNAPNGMRYYLGKRDSTNKSVEYFHKSDWWKATIIKNKTTISSLSDPKCIFEYSNGRLVRFCFGGDFDTFRISYTSPNRIQSITSEKNNKNIITAIYLTNSSEIEILTIGDQRYTFSYTDNHLSFPKEQSLYAKLKLLNKITYPDGKVEEFKYSNIPHRSRTVISERFEKRITPPVSVCRLDVGNEYIEWDIKTGIIMSDSSGMYEIGNEKFDELFSTKTSTVKDGWHTRHSHPNTTRIIYNRENAKYPEIYAYDWENAIKILGNPHSGEVFRYNFIASPGAAFMALRKTEKLNGEITKNKWSFYRVYSYDDLGRLIREIDNEENVIITEYFGKSNDVSKISVNDTVTYYKKIENGKEYIYKVSDNGVVSEIVQYLDKPIEIKKMTGAYGNNVFVSKNNQTGILIILEDEDEKNENE